MNRFHKVSVLATTVCVILSSQFLTSSLFASEDHHTEQPEQAEKQDRHDDSKIDSNHLIRRSSKNRFLQVPTDPDKLKADRNLIKAIKIRERVDPNHPKSDNLLDGHNVKILKENIIRGQDGSLLIMKESRVDGKPQSTTTYIGGSVNHSDRNSSACSNIGGLGDNVSCE